MKLRGEVLSVRIYVCLIDKILSKHIQERKAKSRTLPNLQSKLTNLCIGDVTTAVAHPAAWEGTKLTSNR